VPLSIPYQKQLPKGIVSSSLPIDLVSYEVETPVIFLTKTLQNQPLLVYVADETLVGVFMLLAPISREEIEALQKGLITLRDMHTASWLWHHISGASKRGVWNITLNKIPIECLPMTGVKLFKTYSRFME
jgi:hypothetical protein